MSKNIDHCKYLYKWIFRCSLPGLLLTEEISVDDYFILSPGGKRADGLPYTYCFHRHEGFESKFPIQETRERLEELGDILSLEYPYWPPENIQITLENELDLKERGVKLPEQIQVPILKFTQPTPIDIKRVEMLIRRYSELSDLSVKERVKLSSRWIRKSSTQNLFDRFISLWIAFNALYSIYMKNSERKAIEEYIRNNFTSQSAIDILETEDSKNFIKAFLDSDLCLRKRDVSSELRTIASDPQKKTHYVDFLVTLVLCIYAVRNLLFHGRITFGDTVAAHKVKAGGFFLWLIVNNGRERLLMKRY